MAGLFGFRQDWRDCRSAGQVEEGLFDWDSTALIESWLGRAWYVKSDDSCCRETAHKVCIQAAL